MVPNYMYFLKPIRSLSSFFTSQQIPQASSGSYLDAKTWDKGLGLLSASLPLPYDLTTFFLLKFDVPTPPLQLAL